MIPDKNVMEMDIENTRKEIEAYTQILAGFRVLQGLPESEWGGFRLQIIKYEDTVRRCTEFYTELKGLYKKHYGDKGETNE